MCTPIRDGGRRCAIHQHQNIAAIKTAAQTSSLTRYQTERLFSELTREGRRAEPLDEFEIDASHERIRGTAEMNGIGDEVNAELNKSLEHDRELDGPSGYAQRTIIARANKRGANLKALLKATAERTGLSYAEVEKVYKQGLTEGNRERGAEYPEEYTPNTRHAAVNADLPYDVASVVAIERVKNLETNQDTRQRITRTPVELNATNRWITGLGYDDGRLEVEFLSYPDKTFAYRNVPESLWQEMSESDNPYLTFSQKIVGREEYQYESSEAAEEDGKHYKCASCGQFAASAHSCPVREKREEISKIVPVDKIDETLKKIPGMGEQIIVEVIEPAPVAEEEKPEDTPETAVPAEKTSKVAAADVEPVSLSTNIHVPNLDLPNPEADFDAAYAIKTNDIFTNTSLLEEQLNPTLTKTRVWTQTDDGISTGRIFDSSEGMNGRYAYWLREAPEEIKTEVEKLHKEGVAVLVHSVNGEMKIIKTYDTRYFKATTRYGSFAQVDRVKVTQPTTISAVEAVDLENKAKNIIEDLEARDDVVKVNPIATVSKRLKADPSIGNPRDALKARIGDVREIKKAFKEGKAVSIPAYVEVSHHSNGFDDQGYSFSHLGSSTVQGRMVFRQNKDGAVELISHPRSLKCNCYTYRNNYYCEHINYAARHFPNIVAQATVPSVRAAVSDDPVERARARLIGNLTTRTDVSLVTSKVEGEPDYLTFGDQVQAQYTWDDAWKARERTTVPAEFRGRGNLTFEQQKQLINLERLTRRISSLKFPPKMGEVRAALKRGDVNVPVNISINQGYIRGIEEEENNLGGNVTGSILYKKTADPNEAEVRENRLKCNCAVYQKNYSCTHTRFVASQPALVLQAKSRADVPNSVEAAVRNNTEGIAAAVAVIQIMQEGGLDHDEAVVEYERQQAEAQARLAEQRRLDEERRRLREAQEAEIRARLTREREEANRETVAGTTAYLGRLKDKWNNVDGSYAADPDAYYADFDAALKRKANGESPIVFKTENVTDGMATPEAGARRFGVELEFDLSSTVDKSAALSKIAKELHEAGLTKVAHQQGYHSAQGDWSSWSFEQDMTVAGEVVSPILSDTPEHWEQLRQVVTILKRNGAVTTSRTGSHVHVSTASYGSSTAKNAQLLRDTNADEDVLYRLASNPATGKHRGTQWCGPNVDDDLGDIPEDRRDGHSVLRPISYNNHNIAVNFGGATNHEYEKNHVEFRHWDASLDEGVIQQQIVASLGVVDRAERTVLENGGTKKERRNKIAKGANKAEETILRKGDARRKLSREEFDATNNDAREFIDSIVRRPEDRAGLAALFAITKWQDS